MLKNRVPPVLLILTAVAILGCAVSAGRAESLRLQLRDQRPTAPDSGRFHVRLRSEEWDPKTTAVIVCDVWDYHHCLNAVRRLEEFGPRLNEVVKKARQLGATIIHAPSDCMPAYADHPARARALAVPKAAKLPENITQWCSLVPAERKADYPIDQSDGGEDDDPKEHAEWSAKLKALGRNPGMPWQRQNTMIAIDAAADYISDRGDEVWSILEARGIRHVILTGVHVNMCVLGRPFGLRRMVLGGREAVLMRDMTDTMYDPTSWPYINHYTANDRIIDHIERFVCPTITSDQLLGGKPFRFKNDKRPHLAIVVAEEGYGTDETLPKFAAEHLGRDFHVSYVFGRAGDARELPGLEVLDNADLALLSVRRRVLKPKQMAIVRRFVAAGKPVLGIRTASHGFALNNQEPPAGYEAWSKFDVEVFGARYEGHSKTNSDAVANVAEKTENNPLLTGISREPQRRPGGFYQISGLSPQAQLLLDAEQDGARQPLAWTFQRPDGGRSFYTSLGERQDFANPNFTRLLYNAVYWSAGLPVPAAMPTITPREALQRHWTTVRVPGELEPAIQKALDGYTGPLWYRCVVRIPAEWRNGSLALSLTRGGKAAEAWFNGETVPFVRALRDDGTESSYFLVAATAVSPGDANLITVRYPATMSVPWSPSPRLVRDNDPISLSGRWQMRIGDDPSWSNMPLPAKFGASTDIVIDPELKSNDP